MARQEARRSLLNLRRPVADADADVSEPPPPRFVRLPPFWKAMIITSFVINMLLVFLLVLIAGFFLRWRAQIGETTLGARDFARANVVELRDVVQQLQSAHIKTTIPLNQPLPVHLVVPIDQTTLVTTTADVPLSVPAFIDMGPFGQLRPNVNLSLPAGTQLLIALKLNVPLDTTIPVKLDVPVDIAMKDTELAPQFRRLGGVVDRLVAPAAPLLNLNIPQPDPPQGEEPQK
jgi:hypothetical protein